MKLLSFALLAVLASVLVAESVIDYSKLPDCAHQCAVLDQAEKNCVPPAAPVTDQGIYQSCLCQSALLTTLHSSGTLCQQFCSTDDANKISQYYVALCNGPVVQPPAATTIATTTRASTSTSAKGTATAGAAGGTPVSTSPKSDWCVDRNCNWPQLQTPQAFRTRLTLLIGSLRTGNGSSWSSSSSLPLSSFGSAASTSAVTSTARGKPRAQTWLPKMPRTILLPPAAPSTRPARTSLHRRWQCLEPAMVCPWPVLRDRGQCVAGAARCRAWAFETAVERAFRNLSSGDPINTLPMQIPLPTTVLQPPQSRHPQRPPLLPSSAIASP